MRVLFFSYGIICYLLFLVTFLYAIGFVGNFVVPKSMDVGAQEPFAKALVINALLLSLFALQHSVMARRGFKIWWAKIIPKAIERNTYVLCSSLALLLIFWQWRPMGGLVWDVSNSPLGSLLIGISMLGWLVVLVSTFLLDHFELLGLKQAYSNLLGKEIQAMRFKTPWLYKYVRHPIYFGFTLAFWATPTMTVAHLFFAIGTLGYVLVGIYLEERDLVAHFGDQYRDYKKRVSMLVPFAPKRIDKDID